MSDIYKILNIEYFKQNENIYLRIMKFPSSIKDWKERVKYTYMAQDYGQMVTRLDVDKLKKKYHLFPNETLYVIDCQKAELLPLSENFSRIVGLEGNPGNDLEVLYKHVDESNQAGLDHWIMTNLKIAFGLPDVRPEIDVFKCIYRTVDNRIILKCTTALDCYDSSGVLRYTLGKLMDLTGLTSFNHFDYKYEGPNKEEFYKAYKIGVGKNCHLTQREKQILSLLSEGFTSQVIATKLFISVHTVDTHRRNIIEKMETKTALEAFWKCKNLGWL